MKTINVSKNTIDVIEKTIVSFKEDNIKKRPRQEEQDFILDNNIQDTYSKEDEKYAYILLSLSKNDKDEPVIRKVESKNEIDNPTITYDYNNFLDLDDKKEDPSKIAIIQKNIKWTQEETDCLIKYYKKYHKILSWSEIAELIRNTIPFFNRNLRAIRQKLFTLKKKGLV